jgi:hypothetical protein
MLVTTRGQRTAAWCNSRADLPPADSAISKSRHWPAAAMTANTAPPPVTRDRCDPGHLFGMGD